MKLLNHDSECFFIFGLRFSVSKFVFFLRLLGFSIAWLIGWWLFMNFQSDDHSAFVALVLGWYQLPVMVSLYAFLSNKLQINNIFTFLIAYIAAAFSFYPLLLLTYYGLSAYVW